MSPKELRVVNPAEHDEDSPPPAYQYRSRVRPSHTSRQLASPAGPRLPNIRETTAPDSPTRAEPPYAVSASSSSSVVGSETYTSDDTPVNQSYRDISGKVDVEPRYLYYQVYSDGESILVRNFFTARDPYLGRLVARRIAPPHTAVSIKYYLSKQEGIADPNHTLLFSALSSPQPLEDQAHVSILAISGPGSSPMEPMALVISNPQDQSISNHSTTVSQAQSSSSSIVMVDREPTPWHFQQGPVMVQINHGSSKDRNHRRRAGGGSRGGTGPKRPSEESSKQKARSSDQQSLTSDQPNKLASRLRSKSIFNGLARLAS